MSQPTRTALPSGIEEDTFPSGEDGWPAVDEYGLDWGDVTLLRAQLALSPTERLRHAERFAYDAESLRNARRL